MSLQIRIWQRSYCAQRANIPIGIRFLHQAHCGWLWTGQHRGIIVEVEALCRDDVEPMVG